IARLEAFEFEHAVTSCDASWLDDPHRAACESHARYLALLSAVGMWVEPGMKDQPGPYNLLVTREWMMLVPRLEECFEDISINAIGYAGGLLVRDDAQLRRIQQVGPLRVIHACGVPTIREP
ncbi:MAG: phosphorylase, partial [Myxococcota bacterium]